MPSRNGTRRASLYDFRDLDLMLAMAERGDDEGWCETYDLASSFGFGDHLQPLGIRLSWMKRYGMVDHREAKSGLTSAWRLSAGGWRVIDAKLKATQRNALEKIPDEAMVDVMADITARFHRGDAMLATMLRREFAFGTQRR